MNISRAAALTHIKVQNLEMMENDDFSKMPAPTYAKGFIRIYSGLLGLDSEPLIQEYIDRHLNAPEETKPPARVKKTEPTTARGDEKKKSSLPAAARVKEIGSELRKKLGNLVPHLPRIGVAVVAALLLVGVVRCAVRMKSGSENEASTSSKLDSRAIMREPPVRYLNLPSSEGDQP